MPKAPTHLKILNGNILLLPMLENPLKQLFCITTPITSALNNNTNLNAVNEKLKLNQSYFTKSHTIFFRIYDTFLWSGGLFVNWERSKAALMRYHGDKSQSAKRYCITIRKLLATLQMNKDLVHRRMLVLKKISTYYRK